jgi:methyl-galactoside transport system ATP-binding protein
METNGCLLEAKKISKSFPGVKALDEVDFSLQCGSVHALIGENGAGKSTLMKCLFGIYREDSGQFLINGASVSFQTPKQAIQSGISMVHQELNQVSTLRVMDNIWLGRFPKKYIAIDEKVMIAKTKEIFDDLEIRVDPEAKIANLSVSECQMVEIAKAASQGAKIIVMDEPTSSLSEKEVDHLFRVIGKLKEKQCGIIYISHKLDEILRIADEVTIMRDGKHIATQPVSALTIDKMITMMVGRQLTQRFPKKTNVVGKPLLEVDHLKLQYEPLVEDVSFSLHAGEILGIAGLEGSKRTEIVEGLFGVRKVSAGKVLLHGRACKNKTPRNSISNGFALLTEERKFNGIFSGLNIENNIIIANLPKYRKVGVLKHKAINKDTSWVVDRLQVKTPSTKTLIRNLSGGNQQKVIFGRWLLTQPQIFLLDEPTRGIDVGAKYEIYQLILELANEGKGVIMISSEMPELLGVADRIMVMSNGRIAGFVDTKKTSQEEILQLAAKFV